MGEDFYAYGYGGQNVDAMAEKEKQRILRMQRAMAHLCETDEGVEFLRWLLNESSFFTATYPREFKDATWNEGRRAVACEVFAWCRETPDVMKALFAYNTEEK